MERSTKPGSLAGGAEQRISELERSLPGTSYCPKRQVMLPVLLKLDPTTVTLVPPRTGP